MDLGILNLPQNKSKQLIQKGLQTPEDILWFFPRRYLDFRKETGVRPKEEKSCLVVRIESVRSRYQVPQYLEARGWIEKTGQPFLITWFNQMHLDHRIRSLIGKSVYVCGNVEQNHYQNCLQITGPDIFTEEIETAKKIYPVYSKIRGMSQEYFETVLERVFSVLQDYQKAEVLPEEERKRNGLLTRQEAFNKRHFPQCMEDIKKAKERFDFEDLLYFAAKNEWNERKSSIGSPYQIQSLSLMRTVEKELPFCLTQDQKAAVEEMIRLVQSGRRLNALVQGDVGSGKSIVGFLPAIAFSSSGYQSVIMAPTQILARQHYKELTGLVGDRLRVVYLGAELKAAEKRKIKKIIEKGEADIIVGTHALVADDIKYQNLALCVIDEEHKFGVKQRESLVEKAGAGVHVIKLSATPIPRSLTEVVFGKNVQVLCIKTKPQGRLPVKTGIAVSRERIYRSILAQKKKGHQVYVVCPMIEGNEKMENVKSVAEIEKEYRQALCPYGVRIGTVTGKDAKAKAEETIAAFRDGSLDVLIATSVIEVGVNVPNATGIIVCSADRFGLAQLHQLRGRVGRSSYESYCAFEVENLGQKARERLQVLCETSDGFAIAEADLALRGGGDILGTAQSGMDRYIELIKENPALYEKAKRAAVRLLDAPGECIFLRDRVFLEANAQQPASSKKSFVKREEMTERQAGYL